MDRVGVSAQLGLSKVLISSLLGNLSVLANSSSWIVITRFVSFLFFLFSPREFVVMVILLILVVVFNHLLELGAGYNFKNFYNDCCLRFNYDFTALSLRNFYSGSR